MHCVIDLLQTAGAALHRDGRNITCQQLGITFTLVGSNKLIDLFPVSCCFRHCGKAEAAVNEQTSSLVQKCCESAFYLQVCDGGGCRRRRYLRYLLGVCVCVCWQHGDRGQTSPFIHLQRNSVASLTQSATFMKLFISSSWTTYTSDGVPVRSAHTVGTRRPHYNL